MIKLKTCYKPEWGPILCDYNETNICHAPEDIRENCKRLESLNEEAKP